jgi:uncharacterized Zn-finger protein
MIRAKITIQCDLIDKKKLDDLMIEIQDRLSDYALSTATTSVVSQTVPLDVDEMFSVMATMETESVRTLLGMDEFGPEICPYCGSVMQDGECLGYQEDPAGHDAFRKKKT